MKVPSRRAAFLFLFPLACGGGGNDAGTGGFSTAGESGTGNESNETGTGTVTGDGDGDGDPGDGDGDPGDGDGDPGDGDGDPGDGDGDPGDGDGDSGDGDGDGDTGDGDGDGDTGDGDGDGDTGDGDGDPIIPCPLQDAHVPCDDLDADPFHALGLGCPGNPPATTPVSATTFNASDSDSWKVAEQFGTSGTWSAHEGEKLLIISTGTLPDPNNMGQVVLASGAAQPGTDNGNNDGVNSLPNPIEPIDGSGGVPFENCDGVNDCSDTLQAQWDLGMGEANDLIWFRFDVTVPADAEGYEFDFAFFSSEFPEWVDTQYNDIFVVWSTSETYTGNVTFIDGQPLTITALDNEIVYQGNNGQIAGTGVNGNMMGPIGGSTGWFTATGSAAPNEDFTLAWALFDMGDAFYDTTVILDDFRWSCEGCIPSEIDGCGLIPQ
jgi:hypothetical protein